jgi:hypothetical protein
VVSNEGDMAPACVIQTNFGIAPEPPAGAFHTNVGLELVDELSGIGVGAFSRL